MSPKLMVAIRALVQLNRFGLPKVLLRQFLFSKLLIDLPK